MKRNIQADQVGDRSLAEWLDLENRLWFYLYGDQIKRRKS